MKGVPLSIGTIHFVGIGGIGLRESSGDGAREAEERLTVVAAEAGENLPRALERCRREFV